MATNSQETPEYRTFREHYDRLVHAIQDPLPLATRLFSKDIITSAVKERMIVLGLTTLEKNNALLCAVEKQIQTNPCTLHWFLSALNEDSSLRALVESIQGVCLICEDKKDRYRIVGNFRGRKLLQISWFCGYLRKFSPQILGA